jgi:phosphate transport system substrate-binding protein
MEGMTQRMRRRGGLLGLTLALALVVAACGNSDDGQTTTGGGGGTQLSGRISIDGSSTVAPLSEAAAELFQEQNPNVRVTVGTSGTGGGFEKFCAGETDISDASRAIEADEIKACESKGIKYEEVQVANDGLSVVVNNQNTWANCLTTAQLKKIWDKGSTVNNWNQVDPSFPNEPLKLFGAGTDSGTFDYFTEAINGEEGRSRSDYSATEDDNVTVTGVSGAKGGLGYFGLSYLQENQGKVKGIQVDGGGGCVAPTVETVQNGSYKPLSRPLFIYPSDQALARPEVKAFLEFYVNNYQKIAEEALFVPLTEEQAATAKQQIAQLATG